MRFRTTLIIAIGTFLHIAASAQERASASLLSEHHLQALASMEPQQQAEFLLERAINRYQGATDEIAARTPSWFGRIKSTSRLESLFRLAINSDDMRVRIAAIEVNVTSRGLARSEDTIDRLEPIARQGAQGPRAKARKGRAPTPCGTSACSATAAFGPTARSRSSPPACEIPT